MENKRSIQDIEPFCEWRKEENSDILEVHLPGFQKQQMKVQVNSCGVLTISGERPADEQKWNRFRKEINVPKDRIRSEIRAKLSGGILYITMPKRIPPDQAVPENGMREQNDGKDHERPDAAAAGTARTSSMLITKPTKWGVPRLQMDGKTALKLGALAAVVVAAAVGAYVAYKYRRAFHVEE